MKRECVSFISVRAWVFGEWITPSFQHMFYGVCWVSALDCQSALSFSIFRKCKYAAWNFSLHVIFWGHFIRARGDWREDGEMEKKNKKQLYTGGIHFDYDYIVQICKSIKYRLYTGLK